MWPIGDLPVAVGYWGMLAACLLACSMCLCIWASSRACPSPRPVSQMSLALGPSIPLQTHWTCAGGLQEVISGPTDKLQADIVLSRYFECVDPVYPMLHRQTFYADYEHFWSLSKEDKNRVDASFIALVFVMLALGTQFVTTTPPHERKQTAEFYASASNQSLRLSSYLSTASLRSVQAMVLITYFLINDNHASRRLGVRRDPYKASIRYGAAPGS